MKDKVKVKEIVMHTLYKQSGKEVRVNENSLKYGLSIGWTKEKPKNK